MNPYLKILYYNTHTHTDADAFQTSAARIYLHDTRYLNTLFMTMEFFEISFQQQKLFILVLKFIKFISRK